MPVSEVVETATTYDDALAAFEALPESFDERPAEEAPAAVASPSEPATVAAGEPAVQVAVQPDAEQARVKAEIDALLDRPVPATAEFPKIFHGQPMRKLVASMSEQDRFITKISEEKSLMHDELVAAQAAARVLMQRGGQPGTATVPAAKPTDDTSAFFQRHGVEDPFKEFTKDPTVFFHKLVKFALADAKEETKTLVEPLGQTVTASQNRERLTVAKNAVDSAFDRICQEDKVTDPDIRIKARARFDQLFGSQDGALAAHVGRTGDIYNPTTWIGAYRNFEKAVGGFPPLMAPPAALPTNTTRANPPSSARSSASVIGAGGKTVSSRRSAAVHSLFENSGLPDVENLMAQVENEIDGHLKSGYLEK